MSSTKKKCGRKPGQTQKGSSGHIIKNVHKKLDGKVSLEDIEDIINRFWDSRFGVLKYLKGYKSFSVKRMLFFSVYKNKLSDRLEHQRSIVKKYNKIRAKKSRMETKRKQREAKKALHQRWKEEKKQKWLKEKEESKNNNL